MKKLSAMIKARRAKLEITAEQAAKKMKMSVNYLRLIESGYPTHVSEKTAERLVRKLGVPRSIRGLLPRQNAAARKEARKWRKKAA